MDQDEQMDKEKSSKVWWTSVHNEDFFLVLFSWNVIQEKYVTFLVFVNI